MSSSGAAAGLGLLSAFSWGGSDFAGGWGARRASTLLITASGQIVSLAALLVICLMLHARPARHQLSGLRGHWRIRRSNRFGGLLPGACDGCHGAHRRPHRRNDRACPCHLRTVPLRFSQRHYPDWPFHWPHRHLDDFAFSFDRRLGYLPACAASGGGRRHRLRRPAHSLQSSGGRWGFVGAHLSQNCGRRRHPACGRYCAAQEARGADSGWRGSYLGYSMRLAMCFT